MIPWFKAVETIGPPEPGRVHGAEGGVVLEVEDVALIAVLASLDAQANLDLASRAWLASRR